MAARFIVVVSEDGDGKRGEITVTDNARTAEHLVETLLEAGFPQERIRLFSGEQTPLEVHTRPVVSLIDEDAPQPGKGASVIEPAPAKFVPSEETESADGSSSEDNPWADAEDESEDTPYVRDGVRFSSLFRGS